MCTYYTIDKALYNCPVYGWQGRAVGSVHSNAVGLTSVVEREQHSSPTSARLSRDRVTCHVQARFIPDLATMSIRVQSRAAGWRRSARRLYNIHAPNRTPINHRALPDKRITAVYVTRHLSVSPRCRRDLCRGVRAVLVTLPTASSILPQESYTGMRYLIYSV